VFVKFWSHFNNIVIHYSLNNQHQWNTLNIYLYTVIVQQCPSPFLAVLIPEVFFPFIFPIGILNQTAIRWITTFQTYLLESTWKSDKKTIQGRVLNSFIEGKNLNPIKGSLHLWKYEDVFKMGNVCRRNAKLFLNLEFSRLRKDRKCIFGLCGWKTTTPRMHFLRCPRKPHLPLTAQ